MDRIIRARVFQVVSLFIMQTTAVLFLAILLPGLKIYAPTALVFVVILFAVARSAFWIDSEHLPTVKRWLDVLAGPEK